VRRRFALPGRELSARPGLLGQGGIAVEKFAGKRVVRSATLRLEGGVARVFRLFEPEGEKAWSPEWDYEVVYAEESVSEPGAVFRTGQAEAMDAVWVVSEHDAETGRVGYLVVRPESRVTEIKITVKDGGNGTSTADVRYTHTGLTEAGNEYVESVTEEGYRQYMRHWEMAINEFLRTGVGSGRH
jgi:hypothetical protein